MSDKRESSVRDTTKKTRLQIITILALFSLLILQASATTTTFTIVSAGDGMLGMNVHNLTWAQARDNTTATTGGTSGLTDSIWISADIETDRFYRFQRFLSIFDTSALPDDEVITGATLTVYINSAPTTTLGDAELNVVKFTIDGTVSTDDFNNFAYDNFSTGKQLSGLTTGNTTYTLNSLALSNISKTGDTGLGLLLDWDITNTAPSWVPDVGTLATIKSTDSGAQYAATLSVTHGAPEAVFTANQTNGIFPLAVAFTDLSTGTPDSWNWSYSNTTGVWTIFSTDQNPTQVFTHSDNYDINLTITSAGGSDTETKTNYLSGGSWSIVSDGTTATSYYPNGTAYQSSSDHTAIFEGVSSEAASHSTVLLTGNIAPVSKIDIANNLDFIANGNATIRFDTNTTLFSIVGTYKGIANVSSNVAAGATSVAVTDASGITAGDIVILYDSTETFLAGWDDGEIHEVESVDGTTVNLGNGGITNPAGYQTADTADLLIYTPYTVRFSGIAFYSTLPDVNTIIGIYLQRTKDSVVTNCTFTKTGTTSVGIYNSVNTTVTNSWIWDNQAVGLGYGVSIADAVSNVTITGLTINHTRHCVASGGAAKIGNPRGIYVGFNNFKGGIPVDGHGEMWEYTIDSNIVESDSSTYAIELGSLNAWITNNTFRTPADTGLKLRGDIDNCTWYIQNNVFDGPTIGARLNDSARAYSWDHVTFTGNTRGDNLTEMLTYGGPDYILDLVTDMEAPAVRFTSDEVAGSAPLTVQFTDTSGIFPTSFLWNFGDGTSTSQSPSHVFSAEGNYTVNLTATNFFGSNATTSADYWVNVSAAVTPTPTPTYGGNASTGRPLSTTSTVSTIVSALTLVGIMLIGAGALGIIYSFVGAPNPTVFIVSIIGITVGTMMLLISYAILSPILSLVV